MTMFKDAFISYGRRESLAYVGKLHRKMKLAGYEVWFDKVNIPHGEDYAQRIRNGIESAHNFVYIIAPHCLKSYYCLIELEYAHQLGKRIIPVFQFDLSAEDRKNMTEEQRSYVNRTFDIIGKIDWIYGRETLTEEDVIELKNWAEPYENTWKKHDDVEYLTHHDLPSFGKMTDDIEAVFAKIRSIFEKQKDYVHTHTQILHKALAWDTNNGQTEYLLVGTERTEADKWLLQKFEDGAQRPCFASDLHADYICESRKNAENMLTDVFISYSTEDKKIKEQVKRFLAQNLITTWVHSKDIRTGKDFWDAIECGIEQADNFLFFISEDSIASDWCLKELEYAQKLNKRIIPILIERVESKLFPISIKNLQYINFIDKEEHLTDKNEFDKDTGDLLRLLHEDAEYYQDHKRYLVQAIRWENQNKNDVVLLRGHNLDKAKVWLEQGKYKPYKPIELHERFIAESLQKVGTMTNEIFISYSRTDGDLARKLNVELQTNGKTTWFDQECIPKGADFQQEIYNGIESSQIFLFVISPDAVRSPYCQDEVNYAKKLGKKCITVLCKETNTDLIPELLRSIQWIDFVKNEFGEAFSELMRTLNIDRQYIIEHTRWQNKAIEWDRKQRDIALLLRGSEFAMAEAWLFDIYGIAHGDSRYEDLRQIKNLQKPPKNPQITDLQIDFFAISKDDIARERREERKTHQQLKILLVASILCLIVALAGGMYAFVNMEKSKTQRLIIDAQNFARSPNAQNHSLALALAAKANERIVNLSSVLCLNAAVNNFTKEKCYFEFPPQDKIVACEDKKIIHYNDTAISVVSKEGKKLLTLPFLFLDISDTHFLARSPYRVDTIDSLYIYNLSDLSVRIIPINPLYALTKSYFSPEGKYVNMVAHLRPTAEINNVSAIYKGHIFDLKGNEIFNKPIADDGFSSIHFHEQSQSIVLAFNMHNREIENQTTGYRADSLAFLNLNGAIIKQVNREAGVYNVKRIHLLAHQPHFLMITSDDVIDNKAYFFSYQGKLLKTIPDFFLEGFLENTGKIIYRTKKEAYTSREEKTALHIIDENLSILPTQIYEEALFQLVAGQYLATKQSYGKVSSIIRLYDLKGKLVKTKFLPHGLESLMYSPENECFIANLASEKVIILDHELEEKETYEKKLDISGKKYLDFDISVYHRTFILTPENIAFRPSHIIKNNLTGNNLPTMNSQERFTYGIPTFMDFIRNGHISGKEMAPPLSGITALFWIIYLFVRIKKVLKDKELGKTIYGALMVVPNVVIFAWGIAIFTNYSENTSFLSVVYGILFLWFHTYYAPKFLRGRYARLQKITPSLLYLISSILMVVLCAWFYQAEGYMIFSFILIAMFFAKLSLWNARQIHAHYGRRHYFRAFLFCILFTFFYTLHILLMILGVLAMSEAAIVPVPAEGI